MTKACMCIDGHTYNAFSMGLFNCLFVFVFVIPISMFHPLCTVICSQKPTLGWYVRIENT